MRRTGKGRKLAIWVIVLAMAGILTGCGGKTTYEGGNIRVSYDADKWELTYCDTEEYPIFQLTAKESEVVFIALENDGSIIDSFHDSMTGMYGMELDVEAVETVDQWDEKSVRYYTDFLSEQDGDDQCYIISYGKVQDDWLLIAHVQFPADDSGEQNETEKQEVLQILDSLGCSSEAEITGDVEKDEVLQYLAEFVISLKRYEADLAVQDTDQETQGETPAAGEEDTGTSNNDNGRKITDEEAADLQYMEKVKIEDYFGDMSEYEMYAPIGSENDDGFLGYYDHGLSFSAAVYNDGSNAFLYQGLDISVALQKEDWENDPRFSDIQIGEMMANGDDRYVFASARGEDYNGSSYEQNVVFYMNAQGNGVGIQWNLEITELSIDSETYAIVDEIAKCYGVNLDSLAVSGEWAKEDAQWEMERQDVYEPQEGQPELAGIDGYQYLGTTTLSLNDGKINCPVMLPMGWNTNVKEESASSGMHGVRVYVHGYQTISKNYMAEVEDDADRDYRYASEPDEGNQNVRRSEVMAMSGFDQAVYYIVEYDEPDYNGEGYHKRAEAECYIRLEEKYLLNCSITLDSGEYDNATNILLKELETAYGVDLSRYYYEKED